MVLRRSPRAERRWWQRGGQCCGARWPDRGLVRDVVSVFPGTRV